MSERVSADALYAQARSWCRDAEKIRLDGGPYSEEKWCLDRAAEFVSRADRMEKKDSRSGRLERKESSE